MATDRFDAFTKSFSARLSRRVALQATGLGLAAGLTGSRVAAQEATPSGEGTDGTTFLFVQTATAGTFTANPDAGTPAFDGTPTPGGGGDYLLTLEGHHGGTVYFSDRPERVFGLAPTQRFLDGLGFSPGNPPNAALVTQTDDGTEDVVVLELLAPAYNEAAGTLTYGATILDEYQGDGLTHVAAQQQDSALPKTFGRSSLFIDECYTATTCYTRVFSEEFRDTGPIPGGSVQLCWFQSDYYCHPCDPSITYASLDALCNSTYEECRDRCQAW